MLSRSESGGGGEEDGVEAWLGDHRASHAEMNALVMDYLLTEGYASAATSFGEEAGLSATAADAEGLGARISIREAVAAGRIPAAIRLLNDVCPELLDDDPRLHFRLLQQQLLELIRAGDAAAAVDFAGLCLAEKAPELLGELERSLALLAFPEPSSSPFAGLLEQRQRDAVAAEVNAAVLEAGGAAGAPRLHGLLQMLGWAQESLDKAKAPFWRLTDPAKPAFDPPKHKPKPPYNLA